MADAYPYGAKVVFSYMGAPSYSLPAGQVQIEALVNLERVPLYFAREREVVVRGESLISLEQSFVPLMPGERPQRIICRMRSLGCSPCTGAVRSEADTVPKIIEELVATKKS